MLGGAIQVSGEVGHVDLIFFVEVTLGLEPTVVALVVVFCISPHTYLRLSP